MINQIFVRLLLTLLCLPGWVVVAQPLQHMMRQEVFEGASVGVYIQQMSGDQRVVLDYESDRLLVPASTLKILPTATALSLYGDERRLTTSAYLQGSVQGGVFDGLLIVKGSGDPLIGSKYSSHPKNAFFEKIYLALKQKGVHTLQGKLVADASILSAQGVPKGWTWEDLGNYYAAGVYGLNYADNLFALTLDTSVKGKQPRVKSILPEVSGLCIHNELESYSHPYDSAYLYGAPYSPDRYLYGAVPHRSETFTIKGDVPNPPLHFMHHLASYLEQKGMWVASHVVSDESLAIRAYPQAQLLVHYQSEPLAYLVKQTNYSSVNLFAEALLRQVGLSGASRVGVGTEQSLGVLRAYWKDRGVDLASASLLQDGSGLSPANRISAKALVQVLLKMRNHTAFKQSLPLAGEEGTVRSFLRTTPYRGKARLKSGTITGVVAYVGYVKDEYAVAILVNNTHVSAVQVRKHLEELLVKLNL